MYEVLAWTNDNPARAWCECLIWRGSSYGRALWEFQKAKRKPVGAFISLRYG